LKTQRQWIAAAAAGWALALFAIGVLVGVAIDVDSPERDSRPQAAAGPGGAVRDVSRPADPARGGPVRVALHEVRGELATGRRGGAGRSGPSGGGGNATAGDVFVGRSGRPRVGSTASVSSSAPAAGRRASAAPRRPGPRRRQTRRRPRTPAPPAAPAAPLPPPPTGGGGGHHQGKGKGKGKGHQHSNGNHHGHTGGGDDDKHEDDD
jgi:hypothetical protein